MNHTYLDFFAGGGMAGLGLGPAWRCLFANEIDPGKAASYRAGHDGGAELLVRDVAQVAPRDIPGAADLAWASFPCQDLSLAGKGAGLDGGRSGMIRPFWSLMAALRAEGRGPSIIALENVCGAITSNGGRDFAALGDGFAGLGYRFGAVVIDAARFLPQSRPRFFMIGVRDDLELPGDCVGGGPDPLWHTPALIEARSRLTRPAAGRWLWWSLPAPAPREIALADIIDARADMPWHAPDETARLIAMMSATNRAKIEAASRSGARTVGTLFRRTRSDPDGTRRQRAEIRFDGVAGCLRTPSGGSSRQTLIVVEGGEARTRLLSPREAARLMGLPDTFPLPARRNDAWRLAGDGVAVPVVRHLAASIFETVLRGRAGVRAA